NVAKVAASFGGVGVDVGNIVAGQDPTHRRDVFVAFDDFVGVVNHQAVAAKGSEGDQPIADDVGNGIRLPEALTVGDAHEDRRRLSIDTLGLGGLVSEEEHAGAGGGFAQAVAARMTAGEIDPLHQAVRMVTAAPAPPQGSLGSGGG